MTITAWLRQPEKRVQLPAFAVLAVAILWGVARTAHVLHVHLSMENPNHDLYTYYSIWFVLGHRSCADFALKESLYLPHTWFFFTPVFMFGWSMGRLLMGLLNVGAVFYLWWRLSRLAGLQGISRWLLLAFFLSWSAPGNVIGLGNLALICLAATVAAFPFTSPANGVFLAFSAMKQSLVFPLYFYLLFKRPKALIIPTAIFGACGLAVLWWAHMSLGEGLNLPKYWATSVSNWTLVDHTCLRRLLALFISDNAVVSVLKWVIWFVAFGAVMRWVKDPLTLLAALLLLSLLPMYHYAYDLVVAVPALAVLLKRCRLVWPTLMTVSLAAEPFRQLSLMLPAGRLKELAIAGQAAYFPVLILIFIGGLIYLEITAPEPGARPEATDAGAR